MFRLPLRHPLHPKLQRARRFDKVSVPRTLHCTLRIACPVTPFNVADIVVVPIPELVAHPELVMIATFGFEELQLALLRFCVLPSLKCPLALNRTAPPGLRVALLGLTVMEVRVAFVTVTADVPVIEPNVALTAVEPGVSALRIPELAPMVAIVPLVDCQCTEVVRS